MVAKAFDQDTLENLSSLKRLQFKANLRKLDYFWTGFNWINSIKRTNRTFYEPAEKISFFTGMNLFKNQPLTSLKHNTTSHSFKPSKNTDRKISLLQDQTEFLQEQVKSKEKVISSLIENLSSKHDVFFLAKGR